MSSFFTLPDSQKKRKRPNTLEPPKKRFASSKSTPPNPQKPRSTPRKPHRDESISGSDSESDDGPRLTAAEEADLTSGSDSSEGEEETAAERRLRLAERYLENVREEVDEVGFDAEEIDRDLIAERLQEDNAESKGKIYRKLAGDLNWEDANYSWCRNNGLAVTSIAARAPFIYTVGKDLSLIKWQLQELPKDQFLPKNGKKAKKEKPPPRRKPIQIAFARGDKSKAKDHAYKGHTDSILTVAASQDGKFVVTGGQDRKIIIWDALTLKPIRVFTQHRDAVTGLAFRRGTNQLYSSSKDRTIKIWSLDELAYIETLFGHQDEVVDVAALAEERCISVGARDRTARLWKVVEETQLVFRGGGGEKKKHSSNAPKISECSMDRIAMIDEEMFVTGSDNGSLSLWQIQKKKPIFVLPFAHGFDPELKAEEASAERNPSEKIIPAKQPRWITALKTIPYSDVILSGSWDGFLRAWRLSENKRKIEPLSIVGTPRTLPHTPLHVNGLNAHPKSPNADHGEREVVKGVINDISIFERGERGIDGICIVVAVGKEHRMGRWKSIPGGKNGVVVFEVPRVLKAENGVVNGANGVGGIQAMK
ncbi:hypothetical protein B7494_g7303 [Chlorociboria aeruginascens]|nr:hypothetical protein B7494_g7303 [Chlorociboria aeruginascens]